MKRALLIGLWLSMMALAACKPHQVSTDTSGLGDTGDTGPTYQLELSPPSAGQGSSLDVSLTANVSTFRFGETRLDLGPGITIDSITVLDVFDAVASIHVDPDAELGARDALVSVGDKDWTLPGAFTVIDRSIALDPPYAKMGQVLHVSVTGTNTNWADGYTYADWGDGIDVLDFSVLSPGLADARIAVHPDATPGLRDVSVEDGPEVTTLYQGFTVDRAVIIAFWDPPEVHQGDSVSFTLTGLDTHFSRDTTIEFWDDGGPNPDIQVTAQTTADDTHITGTIQVSNAARLDYRDVLVTTGDEAVLIPNALKVLDSPPNLNDVVPQIGFDVYRTIDNATGTLQERVQAYAVFFIPLDPPCGSSSQPSDGPRPYDNNGVWPIPPPPDPVDCPNPETLSAGDFVWFEGPENVVPLHKDVIQSTGQIIYWGQDLTLDDYHFGTTYDLHTQGDPHGVPEVLVEKVQPTVPADYHLLTPQFWGDLTVSRNQDFEYTWSPAQTYPDAIFSTQISGTLAADGTPGFAGCIPWDDGDHTYHPSELQQLEAGPVTFSASSFIQGRYFGLPFSRYQTSRSSSTLSTDAQMILQ